MGTVMIRCPETGREIRTGYEADVTNFRAMPVFFARSYCPICQTEHEWFAQEAWVCDAGHDGTTGEDTDSEAGPENAVLVRQ
jgi:hypothetical protein